MFEDENRIITSTMQHEDVDIENNLRPKSLDDYLGQEKAKERCQIIKYEELTDYCHKLLKNLCTFTIIF